MVQERAPDAWQVDARNVPGRSAVSGYSRSHWHPVVIRRSEDAPTFKQQVKVQSLIIEIEEETMLKAFAVDLHWGDTPVPNKNPEQRRQRRPVQSV